MGPCIHTHTHTHTLKKAERVLNSTYLKDTFLDCKVSPTVCVHVVGRELQWRNGMPGPTFVVTPWKQHY